MPIVHVRKETPAQAWARALGNIAPLSRQSSATLAAMLADVALLYADRPAIIEGAQSVSHGALTRRVNQFARWGLSAGMRPGDVVCILMLNSADYMALWLGLTKIGVVASLVATGLAGDALRHVVRVSAPAHLVADAACIAAVEQVRAGLTGSSILWALDHIAPPAGWSNLNRRAHAGSALSPGEHSATTGGQTALLLFTSGTTGLPKAAILSHYRVLEWSLWFAGMLDTGPQDRLYDCLPMYHGTGGIAACGAILLKGGAVVLKQRFSAADFWPDIIGYGCTVFLYIGELCRILLRTAPAAAPAHALRLCCGNGLQADIWDEFRTRLAIPRILEFYASTEGNVALYNVEERSGALGRLPPYLAHRSPVMLAAFDQESGALLRHANGTCVSAAPGAPGEALGRITQAEAARHFEGYTDEAATHGKVARDAVELGDAWFRTGDIMRKDADGFFIFLDRLGDSFRWKGENVSASQVRQAIQACPGITAAIVYPVAIPGCDGRAGMAAICVEDGFCLDALARCLAEHLPVYARPVFLRICAAVEHTPTHKPIATRLAKEGLQFSRFPDPVYRRDATDGSYALVTSRQDCRG